MFLKFVSNVCRVCMGSGAIISLFENTGNDVKFQMSTELEVSKDDGLPSSLCEKCYSSLITSYEFKKQSISSDQQLRSFVTSINTKFATEIAHFQAKDSEDNINVIHTEIPLESTKIEIEVLNELTEVYEEAEQNLESNKSEEETPSEENAVSVPENNKDTRSIINTASKHLQSDSDVCVECNKSFSNRANLMRHILSHSEVKPYHCTVCGGSFTQNGSLRQHMLKHTGERPYKCKICTKGFTRKRLLDMHSRTHTGEKPFHCEQCYLSFTVKEGLKRHNLSKHIGVPLEIHTCAICRKKLHSKYTLNTHMKLHEGDKREQYNCKYCSKSFLTKYTLQYHERSHIADKSYTCHICNQSFAFMGGLTCHLKKHEDDQEQFICEICNAIYSRKHQLTVHLLSHEDSEQANFECRQCKKTFTLRENLMEHLKGHSTHGDSFTCTKCNITYNTNRNLKLHLVNFHKEAAIHNLNTCDICAIPFVRASDLNQHTAEVHDPIDEQCTECDERFQSKSLFKKHCLEHDILTIL